MSDSAEQRHIKKRTWMARRDRIAFYICSMFPIKKNRISVCSFEGRGGYGCNPKYIVQELHKRNPDYEFIWFVNDMSKEFPDYIKKVPNTLFQRAYWLSTSKIWIDNYRKPYGTRKRKKQYYVNTWHATIAFKNIGLWRKEAFSKMAYLVSQNDSKMIDHVAIDSEWCAQLYPKGLVYDGEFLWSGAPRCDVLYGDRNKYQKKFREDYHLPPDAKVIMFAPTFREGVQSGKRTIFSEVWSLDFEMLLQTLKERFGGEWYLCLRVHPQLAAELKEYQNIDLKEKLIDVSQQDDMYELLAGMDVFITDYSSAAMDAGFAHMPVFIYADDIERYVKDRGGLSWNMTTDSNIEVRNNKEMTPRIDVVLPYSISQNNEELKNNILKFDEEKYLKRCLAFERGVELIFDGKASQRVAETIEARIEESERLDRSTGVKISRDHR